MSWTYNVMRVRTFAAVLGVIEILLGVLIALRPVAPKLSAFGSMGAIVMFLTTLSFLLTPACGNPDTASPPSRRCPDNLSRRI